MPEGGRGSLERRVVNVKQNQELSDPRLTNNSNYDGWRVNEMSIEPAYVDLTLHGYLYQGESIGGSSGAIYKEMIRETIKEHLRKETQLRAKGIKVLSLFFIDKVESFLGDGSNNNDANGQFVQWFDELFREERAKSPQWQELLPQDPAELRRGYFSVLKGKKGAADKFQDTSGTTKADDDAYELIMQQKERLLDENEPTRFVFSHSALREGWDNPNVFQICTLREMGAETERRQTLGRGLRLPVAKSAGGYERVADRGIATLTVVANESYKQFADALQKEYKEAGVEIGRVRKAEFSKIPLQNPDGSLTDENLGYEGSVSIWEHLLAHRFIDKDGVVQPKFQPNTLDFSLNMPVDFMWAEPFVIELVGRANIGKYVKPKSKRHPRTLNKELFANPEFEKFWETISRRTTYRVEVERDQIIENSVKAIKEAPDIDPLRIQVTRAGVKVLRGGAKGQELGSRQQELRGSYDLPDIIGECRRPLPSPARPSSTSSSAAAGWASSSRTRMTSSEWRSASCRPSSRSSSSTACSTRRSRALSTNCVNCARTARRRRNASSTRCTSWRTRTSRTSTTSFTTPTPSASSLSCSMAVRTSSSS